MTALTDLPEQRSMTPRAITPSPIETRGTRRQATFVMGSLWIVGAGFGALFLLLPRPDQGDEVALAVLSGIACLGGAIILVAGARIPVWILHAGVALGTVIISLSLFFSGDPSTGMALLLVWPIVYSAYYFRTRELGAQLVFVALAYAVVLIAHSDQIDEFLTPWLTGMASLAVAGIMMSQLIRQRREAEHARQHLAALVEASTQAIIGTSLTGTIESWNRGAETLFGYSAGDAIGRPVSSLAPADRHRELDEIFGSLRAGAGVGNHETTWLREGNQLIDIALTLAPTLDGDGAANGVSITAHSISERKHLEQVSERLLAESEARARTDALTGLANRRAWDEELRRELARAGRQGWPVCVAMLDLDHFKAFNDEEGHLAGDELLKESAIRWRVALREADFMARYGGEEFSVLLPDCTMDEAVEVIERLRVSTPMGQTCSAGVASWDGSETAPELLRRADGALYSAKRTGRDRLLTA